ncbi:MAG: ADOP family duplicated permease [Acidobacteriia bacterium]|nr:ADOP family duplicated permease [Terriglobia bacterium]
MKLLRRLDYWMHRRKRDAELAEEMEFHRSMAGAPIGNTTIAREDARAVWIWPWLDSIAQDVRYAIRNLRRQPAFALLAILTLGVAIGLNTSFFTVFDAVALRMWPVRDPNRMVKILAQSPRVGRPRGFALAESRYFVENAKSFSGIVATDDGPVRLGFEPFGKSSYAMFVSANYFQALGVAMQSGRGFIPEEDRLDAPVNVAVLSFALWRDHYGADASILGREIRIDEIPFIVVGVAAEEFSGTTGGREDLWIPLPAMQSLRPGDASTREFLRNPHDCCSPVAGRLAPGATRAQALAELTVLHTQFEKQNKLDESRILLADPTILSGHPKRRQFMPVFGLMFAGLVLVLLLACANVSNLLIARAAARQREIETRQALGASRLRIVRQLLTEGFVLAVLAASLGIALAWKLPAYVFAMADDGPSVSLTPNAAVIAYATALAALTCVAFALAPALHGTRRRDPRPTLSMRNVLLAVQVSMSVVLLIGAGLLLSGVQHARTRDPGYRIHDISVISFELPASAYTAERTGQFYAQLMDGIRTIPGMPEAAITAREPLSNAHWFTSLRLPSEPAKTQHDIELHEISADFFDLLGIPLVAGRTFRAGEDPRLVAVINESAAKRYLGDTNPVGRQVVANGHLREIVGVVRDAYLSYLDGVGPAMFQPFNPERVPKLLVRGDAAAAVDSVAAMARRIDPRAHVARAPLADNLDRQLAGSRVMAGIAGVLGAFALLLAAIGISGVFAYVVEQRTKEIGIRMALGAAPGQVIALVISGTGRAVIVGLAIGYAVSAVFARLLAQYLYGVSPYDPRSYAAVALALAMAGLAAAYLPARRATRVDPLSALRCE